MKRLPALCVGLGFSRYAVVCLGLFTTGCASADLGRADEDPPRLGTSRSALTVEDEIAKGGCSSSVVQGLSDQVLDEMVKCLKPGFLVKVESAGGIVNAANHPFLIKPAADALKKAAASKPGSSISVSSMYRTIAQQYFLYRRSACFDAVAPPGTSNHETGIAIDVSDPDNSTWKAALEAQGFRWIGSFDRFHFDYVGPGTVNLKGLDVEAFQRLWNRNHPEDKIAEDGDYGPQTEARIKKSPSAGFPKGAECTPPIPTPTGPNLEITAKTIGTDIFRDGNSALIVDVREGDSFESQVLVKNAGTASASNITLGLTAETPFVSLTKWSLETDKARGDGVFEASTGGDVASNPPKDAPGDAPKLAIGALNVGETKRLLLTMRARTYAIGAKTASGAAPELRAWVANVPGVYVKESYAAVADNPGKQTFAGGDLRTRTGADVYSRTTWRFDGGLLEGWSEAPATAGSDADVSALDPKRGLVVTMKLPRAEIVSPETTFDGTVFRFFEARVTASAPVTATLFWTTAAAPAFDTKRSVRFSISDKPEVIRITPAFESGTTTRLKIVLDAAAGTTVAFDEMSVKGDEIPGDAGPGDSGSDSGEAGPSIDGGRGETGTGSETPSDTGGCSCVTSAQTSHSAGGWIFLVGLAVWMRRQRTSSCDR